VRNFALIAIKVGGAALTHSASQLEELRDWSKAVGALNSRLSSKSAKHRPQFRFPPLNTVKRFASKGACPFKSI
jgi:hypothetical protein